MEGEGETLAWCCFFSPNFSHQEGGGKRGISGFLITPCGGEKGKRGMGRKCAARLLFFSGEKEEGGC